MRLAALITVLAILALSFGGVLYNHQKACCGADMPMASGAHGLIGPCLGLCTAAVSESSTTDGLELFGWLFDPFLMKPLPLLADPIETPPA